MNTVIIIVAIIGTLVAGLLVAALFLKKKYTIRRSILINRPKAQVFDYVKHIKNQDNYNKWVMVDPGMTKSYTGTDGNTGFIYAWDSKNKQAGAGEQEITHITEGERVDMEIRFERPFKSTATSYITTEDDGNGNTIVTWAFNSSMKYPMNILVALFNLEKALGNDLQQSLSNLKNLLEVNTMHAR